MSITPSQSSSAPLHVSVPPEVPPTHWSVPWMHCFVPIEHGPIPPAPQVSPTPGTCSSTVASQSLSMASQTSGVGPVPPVHMSMPITHWVAPGSQAPVPVPHGCASSTTLSSMMPLQSSSMPLHRSGDGPTSPAHWRPPFTQTVMPFMHAPVSLAPQAAPTPVGVLSITPLQSSSRPLQSSGEGPVWPVHTSPPP